MDESHGERPSRPPHEGRLSLHRERIRGAVANQWSHMGRVVGVHAPTLTRGASVHRMTLIALVCAGALVWLVPQVFALFRWPGTGFEWLVLGASALIALSMQVAAWLCVLPLSEITHIDKTLAGDASSLPSRWHKKLEPVGKGLDGVLEYFEDKPKRALGLLLIALAATVSWSQLSPMVVNAAMLCVWIIAHRYSHQVLSVIRTPHEVCRAASKLIGRAFLVVLLTNTVVELLWIAQRALSDGLQYRVYSTWAVLQTMFAIALAFRVIDVLGLLAVPWIRVWPLALLAVILAFIPGGEPIGVRRASPWTATASAQSSVDNRWLEQLMARIDEIPSDQPVLFVAASGGGSRAAITAALVYEQLSSVSVGAGRTLDQNVALVSSVSGGSLATAYFLTRDGDTKLARAVAKDPKLDAHASLFVREMAEDFMAPLLRGVLNLRQERGSAVASFWRDRYQWSVITDSSERAAHRPLAIFNATHVQTGARVGFGIPALPPKLLAPALVGSDLDPNLEIDLADAVRMSANFPYGFEHVVLAEDKRGVSPEIIDGGLVDNTGLDTLVALLENIQKATTLAVHKDAATDDHHRERRALSQRVRDGLLLRGLIVLEIDAGARPGEPSFVARRFPTLSKPLEALGRAGHQNNGALRSQYLQRLRNSFPTNGKASVIGLVRAGFDCKSHGDVMTAWSLDYQAREQIYTEYARTTGRLGRTLVLQQAAIRRLLRPIEDAATPAERVELDSEQANLRLVYDNYVDRMLEIDAEQHSSAPGCKPPRDANHMGPPEAALSIALRKAEQKAEERRAAKVSSPPAPPVARAPKRDSSAELGWVYVGQRAGKGWQTRYLKWGDDAAVPARDEIVELVTSSNLRANLPDDEGRLAPARMVLPARAQLKVLETRSWGGTDFVWARVSVPEDVEAQAATIAKADSLGASRGAVRPDPKPAHPAAAE